jgi:hypothetical protein
VNARAFLTDALGSALELGVATPDDVLRHMTPDVLSTYLPRPLWARLLTACLGASKVDGQLVVDTVGVPNLCEHVPSAIVWGCIAEVAARSLGTVGEAAPVVVGKQSSSPARIPLSAPPPEVVRRPTPQPASTATVPAAAIPAVDEAPARSATAQRFRQHNTGLGRIGQPQARRPQAQAAVAVVPPAPSRNVVRRGGADAGDQETDTAVESDHKGPEMAVDDSQLVDWSTESTDDFSDLGRKR